MANEKQKGGDKGGDKKAAANSESEKMKKLFEEQIATLKRNYEREYAEMVDSFSREHEEMQEMLSQCAIEAVLLKDKYVELDMKFKEYYMRSDHHIKQQATELNAVRQELQTMQYRHKNHETLLQEAEQKAAKFESWYRELEDPFLLQKEELHKLKLEVIKYEQKYSFIDLDKIVNEVAVQKTAAADAKERAERLQIDLFTIREKIIDITQKENDDKRNPMKKQEVVQSEWKAGEDVEALANMLTKYLTNMS